MNRQGTIYITMARTIQARLTCLKDDNNPIWAKRHTYKLEQIQEKLLPYGSGFDSGTTINLEESTGEKIVLDVPYHHMNEHGSYTCWSEHKIIITASLQHGIELKITGKDTNGIKDYIHETFEYVLTRDFIEIYDVTGDNAILKMAKDS